MLRPLDGRLCNPKQGFQIASYTEGAFIEAALADNLEVVRLFVQAGMSVNATDDGVGRTVLQYAAWGGGSLELVEYLVGQGADVTAKDTGGYTALHLAEEEGRLAVVKYLVGAGADVNATTPRVGWTALYRAAWEGHLAVVKYLVGAGADLNAATEDGWMALHGAALGGSLDDWMLCGIWWRSMVRM